MTLRSHAVGLATVTLAFASAAPAVSGAGADASEATASRLTPSTTAGEARSQAKPVAGRYRGRTSQGWTVNLRVSPDRRRIVAFASSVSLICRTSGTYRSDRPFLPQRPASVAPNGAFALVYNGRNGQLKYRGRFVTARKAQGTLTMGSTTPVFGGLEVCVTAGRVTWTASFRG